MQNGCMKVKVEYLEKALLILELYVPELKKLACYTYGCWVFLRTPCQSDRHVPKCSISKLANRFVDHDHSYTIKLIGKTAQISIRP